MKTTNKNKQKAGMTKVVNLRNIAIAIAGMLITSAFIYGKYRTDASLATGNIAVTVKYIGSAPSLQPLSVTKDKSACGKNVPNETLIVGSNKGIKNVMVNVKGAEGSVSPEAFTLQNKGCQFVPHAAIVPKGTKLVTTNEDDVMHNMHAYYVMGKMKRTMMNNSLPGKGSKIENKRVFSRTGMIMFACDAHEWMSAWVKVVDHPYYGVTDEQGNTTIKNVPAGSYTLEFFHEKLGEQTQGVKVEAGKTANVTIEMAK